MNYPLKMLSILEMIRFRGEKTWLHSMDLRVKLLIVAGLITMASLFDKVVELICVLVAAITLIVLAREAKQWLKGSLALWIIVAIVFLVNGFLASIYVATLLVLRLTCFVITLSFLLSTTSPDRVVAFLTAMGAGRGVTAAFMLALRFTPIFMLDAQKIWDAQRARGLGLRRESFVKKLKPLITPLVVRSFQVLHNAAVTMEVRAFNVEGRRTTSLDTSLKVRDVAVMVLAASLIAIGLAVHLLQLLPVPF
ncbi:MAG: hypothetical protein DRJ68_01460 [Thermoprotei archaeon]|nr:MAG: hypothetical protein DRJ62_00425 [Thermoprotei archaeon]RLF22447.1 MAG: hypothetical protein DRJ68_01460 [Thermoprotei archaeon]